MFVHVAAEAIRHRDRAEAVSRALSAVLDHVPRKRPMTVFAEAHTEATIAAALSALGMAGRETTRMSTEGLAVRPGPGQPLLRVPSSWVGSTLLVIASVTGGAAPVVPLERAMAGLARGAGYAGPELVASRAGARLANDVFAGVLALVDPGSRTRRGGALPVLAAALPRDPRAVKAFDAWLARRLGTPRAGPAGVHVRGLDRPGVTWRGVVHSTVRRPLNAASVGPEQAGRS